MASKQKARYIGPDGFVNYDVARETRGSRRMKNGETYEVSDELFASLMLNADWEAGSGSEQAAEKAREASKAEAEAANLGAKEGTTLDELLEQQEESAKAELKASGKTDEAALETPARGNKAASVAGAESKGGDNS